MQALICAVHDLLCHEEQIIRRQAGVAGEHRLILHRALGVLLGKGLDMAAKVFAEYGIEASYHPHLGSMAEAPEQVDRLFAETSIKICPDLAHLAAGGGDPLTIVKKYYDRISFVHLKDLDDNGFAPLGTGRLDIDGVLDFLKEKGYAGDYLVEVDGYAGDPVFACQTSYDFLKGKLL